MKALVMGAGGQGAPCASILSRDSEVTEIKLCDIDIGVLEKVKAKINSPKLVVDKVDATNVDDIARAAEGMDVVIDLVNPAFFTNVMEAALKVGAHYVNTAWEEYLFEGVDPAGEIPVDARLMMQEDFAKKGTTALLGCGMTSGFGSNILARYYVDKLDSVKSIKVRLAKKDTTIPDEEEILYPWNPGWNPKQALLDFVIPTYKFEDKRFVVMDKPFAEPEMWDFPEPIGKTLVTHHAHEEPFSLPFSFRDKGLEYCDFKYYVNKQIAPIVALGLGEEDEIDVKGIKIKPIDVVLSKVPAPGDAFLGEDPSKFDYLDKTKLVAIMVEVIGEKDGKEITYLVHLPSMNTPRQAMYDAYGTSIISVALPAVIGAKMIFEGAIKGVIHPQDLDPNRFIELMRKSGWKNTWEEKCIVK